MEFLVISDPMTPEIAIVHIPLDIYSRASYLHWQTIRMESNTWKNAVGMLY